MTNHKKLKLRDYDRLIPSTIKDLFIGPSPFKVLIIVIFI